MSCTILLVEDEPLVTMDLEFAAEDRGCRPLSAASVRKALQLMDSESEIDVAILDVSLGNDETCVPVARALESRGVPYILHTGDLDRQEEQVRTLDAPLVAKPAAAEDVIDAAMAAAERSVTSNVRMAAQ
ncbi:MAG: response regulator [Erythrobacter sp.]